GSVSWSFSASIFTCTGRDGAWAGAPHASVPTRNSSPPAATGFALMAAPSLCRVHQEEDGTLRLLVCPPQKRTTRQPLCHGQHLLGLGLLRDGGGFGALGGFFLFLGLLVLLDDDLDDLDLGQGIGTTAVLPALLIHERLDPLAARQDVARALQGVF